MRVVRGMSDQLGMQLPWVLHIGGHTDDVPLKPRPNIASNLELSAARAAAAADFLIQQHIPGQQIVAAGYGLPQPLVPNDPEDDRRRNRPVGARSVIPEPALAGRPLSPSCRRPTRLRVSGIPHTCPAHTGLSKF